MKHLAFNMEYQYLSCYVSNCEPLPQISYNDPTSIILYVLLIGKECLQRVYQVKV